MESSGHLTGNYKCNGETSSTTKCVKCPEKSVLESHNATYCEKCFLAMVKGKFRSALSRRKVFRDKDSRKALVILDGSRESAFLFRQIEDAVKQTNFKRLMIEPSFLLLLSSLDISEVHLVAKKLPVFQQALPCTYYVVHLAAVFGNLEIDGSGGCIGLQYLSRLVEVLDSFRTTIAREEMIRLLQVRLIHKFSKSVGISKVMLSSNGDQLAHLAISQLCLGRDSRKALVILDGSRESAFLFRQIEDAVKQTNFKRLMIEPSAYYIFFTFAVVLYKISSTSLFVGYFGSTFGGKETACLSPATGFSLFCTYYVVHLAAVFGNLEIDGSGGCIGLQYLSRLVEVLDSFRTTIAREEMIRLLQVRLIHKFSKSVGISKVMLSSNGDQLAHLAISQLCLGRGGMVSDMTDVVEKTPQGTVFIRPLRSISTEEIATALRLEDVEHYVLIPPVTVSLCFQIIFVEQSHLKV
ncbi:hypothetical protein COOONC_03450 [Cooperia oncophora]